MKKLSLLCILFLMGLCLTGCVGPKQFEVSLKAGLFQGVSQTGLAVSLEFSQMDQTEYVKRHTNKVKDLSTTDTKFYIPYHVNLVLSEGSENYVVEFSNLSAQSLFTTDTYVMQKIQGDRFDRELDLSGVTLQLIDADGDKTADALKMAFTHNGISDTADLEFLSEGEEGEAHNHFRYECHLTCDERIRFDTETAGGSFWAGTELRYSIIAEDGYKVTMYVDGAPYTEVLPDGLDVMRFAYVTGYRDVDIQFRTEQLPS